MMVHLLFMASSFHFFPFVRNC